MTALEDEWLWGWDPLPGIVSVWAEPGGHVLTWRRVPGNGARKTLVREASRFRPWLLLSTLEDLAALGPRLVREEERHAADSVSYVELSGEGRLRYLVRAEDLGQLRATLLASASRRLARPLRSLGELGESYALALPLEEQYLVDSGRTYFRELVWDDVVRLVFDLETTGLDPSTHRIFLIALKVGEHCEVLEAEHDGDAGERQLISKLAERIRAHDPDVIENHNLHGFDLPFLVERARRLGVSLALDRLGRTGVLQRPAALGRGTNAEQPATAMRGDAASARPRKIRYTLPGRELLDTLDAVRRHDFSARDLPGHGLKAVARHLGLASATREYVPGAEVHAVYRAQPERVRRYATDDVREADALARVLGGAAFALARMAPRRYERLADAGPATGVLDPLLTRAYLRSGAALPAHQAGDGTPHTGAALSLFASGVAEHVVKADVASLYPSLMRQYRISPARDRLKVLLALVDRLVEQRLAAKARARTLPQGSADQHAEQAMSAAMKLLVNSAYGYMGAVGLTRFADVHAANEVTRHGRHVLGVICRGLAERGMTLLEADTDGVYFAVPQGFSEADEQRVVSEVGAVLPPLVKLEFEGRYRAMLSHEPKNYALLPYDGPIVLRGVAFRSRRAEPFGTKFLLRALEALLRGDIVGVRAAYTSTALALLRHEISTFEVASLVRLTKTPEQYSLTREVRREHSYEALLANGRSSWSVGEKVRVYRKPGSRPGLLHSAELADAEEGDDQRGARQDDPRDYDSEYYLTLLRAQFASRLERGLAPEIFAQIFSDPRQLSLFSAELARARPVLAKL